MINLAAHRKTYHIVTIGCQMNAHDSEKLAGILQGMGYAPAGAVSEAGLVIYNTCCIRENAENKLYGNLGYMKHMKQKNPGLIVAVGGCMPQQESALSKLEKTGAADIIFGTHNLHAFGSYLAQILETGAPLVDVWEAPRGEINVDYGDACRESPYHSGVNIMYGCDNYCAYCVVPMVRGRERSRRHEDILNEIKALVRDGVKEVTLLGQNVNSYGQKPANGGCTFPELLRMVHDLEPPIERVRFMTSHPKDLSPELIGAIRDCERVCKHIHLPVQSGSNRILQLMNRKYTRENYLDIVAALRREVPEMTITTDIIVGFPGETEDDFEDTLRLVEAARFNGAFTFLYSKREGTRAAAMEDQIPEDVMSRRFKRLLDVLNPISLEINKSFEGRTIDVLVEKLENGIYTGRADSNAPVHFPAGGVDGLVGKIVPIKITEGKTFFLLGGLGYTREHIKTQRSS